MSHWFSKYLQKYICMDICYFSRSNRPSCEMKTNENLKLKIRIKVRFSWIHYNGCRLDSYGSGLVPVAGCYKHDNEPSVYQSNLFYGAASSLNSSVTALVKKFACTFHGTWRFITVGLCPEAVESNPHIYIWFLQHLV